MIKWEIKIEHGDIQQHSYETDTPTFNLSSESLARGTSTQIRQTRLFSRSLSVITRHTAAEFSSLQHGKRETDTVKMQKVKTKPKHPQHLSLQSSCLGVCV